ncbi:hypothetical protein [Neobacillus cucumis]|uniref:hypothetical protein n=1 Tax=Neobacillus cucumis TaxID=1740721 RepID=UPI002E1EA0E9|nr:hypothetical protein [Neobacillus cucumis]
MPDNLALDKNGNLYITEGPGGSYFSTTNPKTKGDDIWVAVPSKGNAESAETTVRYATLTDSEAEPTGIYFDKSVTTLMSISSIVVATIWIRLWQLQKNSHWNMMLITIIC